jgi:hypothetical protein
MPQPIGCWQHYYPNKTRQVGCAKEQFIHSIMSMVENHFGYLEIQLVGKNELGRLGECMKIKFVHIR